MAGRKLTDGWLCRDANDEGMVVFIHSPSMSPDGLWDEALTLQENTPEEFEAEYGFLPEKGSCEFYELEL